jgi:Fur family ferric uptake transcriptional regulator
VDLPTVEVSQSPEEKFREYLSSRPRPQRFTGPQRDMIRFIFSKHEHFDANELEKEMEEAGMDVSRPTIYRTLKKLVDAGLLRRLDVGSRAKYEHDYGYHQHDHMQCEKCGEILEFHDPVLEEIIERVTKAHNFQVSSHSFVVRGICAQCNQKRSIKRRLDLV